MTSIRADATPSAVLAALEELLVGAIGVTAVALARSDASDLTLIQWRAMVVVGRTGAIRISAIAPRVGTSLPSASRLVDRLERRGLVTTRRDERDRRATLVELTAEGRRVYDEVVRCRRELIAASLSGVRLRPDASLTRGLDALAGALARFA